MKRVLSALILLLFALTLPLAGIAQQQSEPLSPVAVYRATASSPQRTWAFPFSDAWFTLPASTYHHELARASLGMALSAFRENDGDASERDCHIRDYLTAAGFQGLVSEQYDITPTVDTIATMIGHKTIGDFTLLCVAVSGGGYQNEWLSNFTVGDETRHVGFNAAAKKVQQRIRTYLSEHVKGGTVKLWVSGYSRAAAVSNITAADMVDSGLFADVFAYTFATPRTTKQRGNYAGIFNIVGKFDPVPLIPFAQWGYERYGTDLYTPAQETDSDYYARIANAQPISQALTGQRFWNNPDVNSQLRTIMDYLLSILPTSEVYAKHMQSIMLRVWQDKSVQNIYVAIADLMEDEDLITPAQREEMSVLLDYLTGITYHTVLNNVTGAKPSHWNTNAGMADNIAHEHVPDVYVAWMFSSDDPSVVFSGSDAYARFVFMGNMDIWIYDDQGMFLWRINADGQLLTDIADPDEAGWENDDRLPVAQRPLLSCIRNGSQTIVTLPKDRSYLLMLQALEDGEISYFCAEYSLNAIQASLENIHVLDVEEGGLYFAYSGTELDEDTNERSFGESDFHFHPFDEESPYTPSLIVTLENWNVPHMSFTELLWLLAGAVAVVLLVVALVTTLLVKRGKKRRARKKAALLEGTKPLEETDEA